MGYSPLDLLGFGRGKGCRGGRLLWPEYGRHPWS
jgi:hypothetical protein